MLKKYGFVAVFLGLLIPVIWLFVLWQSKVVSSKLPIFGEKTASADTPGDTIYHTISDFAFIDQLGDSISNKDFDGSVYVANFFFTSCPDICPSMMRNLKLVYEKYKEAPNVKFLSHTVDPKRDSVSALFEYAGNLDAKPKKWFLVTGTKADLYYAGEYDYLLATVEGDLANAFIHSEKLVLIDKEKRIRGFYDGTNYSEVKLLIEDIKALLTDYRNGK